MLTGNIALSCAKQARNPNRTLALDIPHLLCHRLQSSDSAVSCFENTLHAVARSQHITGEHFHDVPPSYFVMKIISINKESCVKSLPRRQRNASAGAKSASRQYLEKPVFGYDPAPIAATRSYGSTPKYKLHVCHTKTTKLALPHISVHTIALIMILVYWPAQAYWLA